jgi:hypothetical protein
MRLWAVDGLGGLPAATKCEEQEECCQKSHGVHIPVVNSGCQNDRGQNAIDVTYWTQE